MCNCATPNFRLASILAATKLGICQAGFSAMALRAPLMKNSPRAELASSEREMGKTKTARKRKAQMERVSWCWGFTWFTCNPSFLFQVFLFALTLPCWVRSVVVDVKVVNFLSLKGTFGTLNLEKTTSRIFTSLFWNTSEIQTNWGDGLHLTSAFFV